MKQNTSVRPNVTTFAPVIARMTRSIACTIILILPACTALPRAEFNAREQQIAEVPGFKGIRTWVALSSGGSGGAFGAGVLVGWTASGSRPDFDLVSGVSTGALIAPFAFLGSEYDRTLAEIYSSDVAGDVVQMQFLPAGLFGSGILRPEPLRRLVEKYADERLLVAIAGEHRKGRRLLVVTTNMDAQRAIVWDMGKIAASGRFEALKLFRDIVVAS
jgi:predicted acylesterase/phospholipase RssA